MVLSRGEKLVHFETFSFVTERQMLLLFGAMLAACGVGLVLLYLGVTLRGRALRAIAVTSYRDTGTERLALLASGGLRTRHSEDPIWRLARGVVVTTHRLDTFSIKMPFDRAEIVGPLLVARACASLKGDGRHSTEQRERDLLAQREVRANGDE